MTESVRLNNNIDNIMLEMQKANPNSTKKEIIGSIGRYLIEIYYQKISEKELPKKLDSVHRLKLNLQKSRQTKKGRKKIETLFKKDESVAEFEKIRKSFNQLKKFHASNDIYFQDVLLSKEIDYYSSDFNEINRYSISKNKNDVIQDRLKEEPKNENFEIEKNLEDYTSLTKTHVTIECQDIFDSEQYEEINLYPEDKIKRKKTLNFELQKRIQETSLETFDKKKPQKFNLTDFIGIIDD